MDFNNYLESLLGKGKANKIKAAIKAGTPILITGPQIPTGKSTLCEVLRKTGATVFEQHEMYEVTLNRPLKTMAPRFAESIDVGKLGNAD